MASNSTPHAPPPRTAAARLLVLAAVALVACSDPLTVPTDPPTPPVETPSTDGAVLVTALDPGGAPVEGAVATTSPVLREATSGADGALRFDALPAGEYRVTVAADGYLPVVLEQVPVTIGATTERDATLTVDLAAGLPALRVQASYASGRVMDGATLRIDGGTWGGTTDAEGIGVVPSVAAGSYSVELVPPAGAPALSYRLDGVVFEEGALTELVITASGRAPASATWVGSAACGECHPASLAKWSLSAHGSTWTTTPPADLEQALVDDTTASLVGPTGADADVRIYRDGQGDHLQITSGSNVATFDIAGWSGGAGTALVPMLELEVGLAPGPAAWRQDGVGGLSPLVTPGLVEFHLDRWVTIFGAFVDDSDTGGPTPDWLESAACLGCHATGLVLSQPDDVIVATAADGISGVATERAVGCEACHGPGSAHASLPDDERAEQIVNPGRLDRDAAAQVCAQCHSAGTATADFDVEVAWPYSDAGPFVPGADLAGYLDSDPATWPGGAPAGPNQQSDAYAGSPHAVNDTFSLRCNDCHDPHGPVGDGAGNAIRRQLRQSADDNSLCLSCHVSLHFPEAGDAEQHTRHSGYDPGGRYASGRCTGCHMPQTATRFGLHESTGGGELASHGFEPVVPQESLDPFLDSGLYGLPLDQITPNSCLACHRVVDILYAEVGVDFWGPAGDPTRRNTYTVLQAVHTVLFPGGSR